MVCFFLSILSLNILFYFFSDLVLIFLIAFCYPFLNLFFLILSLIILFYFLFNFDSPSFNCFFYPFFILFFNYVPHYFFSISFYTIFGPHYFNYYLFLYKFLIVKNFVQDYILIFCTSNLDLMTRIAGFED